MNAHALKNYIIAGNNPVIEIVDDIDDSADKGMRMRILSVTNEDGYYSFNCDLKEFEDYNLPFEQPTWYDKNQNPCLRWRETSYYPENGITQIYLDYDCDSDVVFTLIEENGLYKEYAHSMTKKNYVQWLEDQVLTLRNSK